MKLIRIIVIFLFSQIVLWSNEKIDNLASNIATPLYNVYHSNVIELIEQYIKKNPNIEAVKIYDTMIDHTTLVYYKQNDKFVYKIDKEFPKNINLPKRVSTASITKNNQKIGILSIYYNSKFGKEYLTKDESKYLNTKKTILMCINPNNLPLEKIENNTHIGFTSEIIKIISKNINIPIKLIDTNSWQESLQFIKDKRCDILSLAQKTKKTDQYLNFTESYVDTSIAIATRTNEPFIDNINQISEKKFAIKRYFLYEKLQKKYPKLDLIEVDTIEDGLKKVEDGLVYGYIDSSVLLNYEIQRRHIGTLAISGSFKENLHLGIASRDDEPLLVTILQKALNSITQEQKEKIYKKWITIKVERIKVIDYSLVYKVVISSIIIILFFLYWIRKIVKINKELEVAKKQIEKLAITDKLTGLFNRVKTDEIIENNIEIYKRYNQDMTLAILDLDHFKSVNDTYGHQVGDEVLKDIANILQQNIRKTDHIGRWGGEEFIIIYPKTNKKDGFALAQKIRTSIESYEFVNAGKQTASFGITSLNQNDTFETMLKRADDALYIAKKNGRNKVEVL